MKEAEERSSRPKRSISPIHRDGIQEVWESTPDQSQADVTYRDVTDKLPTRGLANTMKQKFFQVKNSLQLCITHTYITRSSFSIIISLFTMPWICAHIFFFDAPSQDE